MRLTNMIKVGIARSAIGMRSFKNKWRKQNEFNDTFPACPFPMEKVHVGRASYGPLKVISYGAGDAELYIGHFCSIAQEVTFHLGGEHYLQRITTFPVEKYVFHDTPNIKSKGDIIIGDDVWIGYGATILSGVHIGQGACIAAGAIVCKDVPPYAIYAGTEVKKYRFDQATIDKLSQIDYSRLDYEEIVRHKDIFTHDIDDEAMEYIETIIPQGLDD